MSADFNAGVVSTTLDKRPLPGQMPVVAWATVTPYLATKMSKSPALVRVVSLPSPAPNVD